MQKKRSKTNNDLTSVPPLILWNNRQKNSVSVWGLKLHFSVVEYHRVLLNNHPYRCQCAYLKKFNILLCIPPF